MRRVLFICTGNYYRSRFAEAVFNHHCRRRGLEWSAFSRGLAIHQAPPGLSIHTREALRLRGIDEAGNTTDDKQPLSLDDLAAAVLSIALKEREHRPYMRVQFPDWEDRITYWHVHDLDGATPEQALPEIERKVLQLLHRLERDPASASPAP